MKMRSLAKAMVLFLLLALCCTSCSGEDSDAMGDGDQIDGDDATAADGDDDSAGAGDGDSELSETTGEADGDESEAAEEVDGDEVRWPGCDDRLPTQKITFLHINDLHSEYSALADDEYGSNVARVIGFVKQVKEENPFTVFTDGGDDHEKGSIAEQLSAGYSTIDVVRAMKFDARVIGNHDFAWGEEELLEFSRDPHSIVLASNTVYNGENPSDFGAVNYAELQVGCIRIGLFGMVSKPWNEKNQQYEGDFYPGGNFHTTFNYAEIAQNIVNEHRSSVDLLVMVSHLGLGDDKALAAAVSGIDVILGAHSHSVMYNPEIINDTIIVQAGSDGLFVGRLDLDVNTVSGRIASHEYSLNMNLPLNMPLDTEFQETMLGLMEKWAPGAFEPVGYVKDNLNYDGVAAVSCKAVKEILGVDAVLLDKGEIWEKWIMGGMSRQDMLDSFQVERQPAGTCGFNSFYSTTADGADLMRIRDEMDIEWAFLGPETPDENTVYKLAVQKHVAYNPADYLPEGVSIGEIKEENETWRIIDAYAAGRTENCLYIDADESLPDCSMK